MSARGLYPRAFFWIFVDRIDEAIKAALVADPQPEDEKTGKSLLSASKKCQMGVYSSRPRYEVNSSS